MSKHSIYRSSDGERNILSLYDQDVERLKIRFEEISVGTRFGQTHILMTGPKEGEQLVIFHGGNVTSPISLKWFLPLMTRYRIYAPDTIGHPGKSEQVRISPRDNSYGEWVVDILDALNIEQASFIGPSYGGGILLRTAVYAPNRIFKAVLLVPTGIANGPRSRMIFDIIIPMLRYRFFPNQESLIRAVSPMFTEQPIDEHILELIGQVFIHVKLEPKFPKLVTKEELSGFKAPTLVLAAQNDLFFPADVVIPRAKAVIPNLIAAECLEGSSHFPSQRGLTYINERILRFLEESR